MGGHLRRFKDLVRHYHSVFIRYLIGLVTIFEAPLFLLRNRTFLKNEISYVFYHHSFGHTVLGIDYAARLYFPHRISLFFLPHPRSNSVLPRCFEHNVDVYVYDGLFGQRPGRQEELRYRVLRFYILLISSLSARMTVIDQENVYKTLSIAQKKVQLGNETSDRRESVNDITGYLRLLRHKIGLPPSLPNEITAACTATINKKYPGLADRPFVCLLLKRKGLGGRFDDHSRCSGPHENYLPAVKYLIEQGLNVIGTGETDHAIFNHLPGYYSLRDTDLQPEVLNLYILSKCSLYIGQQSGPMVLLNSCNIPCLIADAYPYALGSFNSVDIVLFKHLLKADSGHRLSVAEVFKKHTDLALGHGYSRKGITIQPCPPLEILSATKEILGMIRGEMALSVPQQALADAFVRLYSKEMPIYYHRNRTSLDVMRTLESELQERLS